VTARRYTEEELLCASLGRFYFCGRYSNGEEFNVSAPALSGSLVGPVTTSGESGVFLNTALDVDQAQRLPITSGTWQLRYEFFAIDFPVLSVLIELTITDWSEPIARMLTQGIA
jgi:hypothetical protein